MLSGLAPLDLGRVAGELLLLDERSWAKAVYKIVLCLDNEKNRKRLSERESIGLLLSDKDIRTSVLHTQDKYYETCFKIFTKFPTQITNIRQKDD